MEAECVEQCREGLRQLPFLWGFSFLPSRRSFFLLGKLPNEGDVLRGGIAADTSSLLARELGDRHGKQHLGIDDRLAPTATNNQSLRS